MTVSNAANVYTLGPLNFKILNIMHHAFTGIIGIIIIAIALMYARFSRKEADEYDDHTFI